jgi:hypothetical protein
MAEPTGPNPNPFAEDIEAAWQSPWQVLAETERLRQIARNRPQGRMSTGERIGKGSASAGPDSACACFWCGAAIGGVRSRESCGRR